MVDKPSALCYAGGVERHLLSGSDALLGRRPPNGALSTGVRHPGIRARECVTMNINCWIVCGVLFAGLLLIVASISGVVRIALPLAVVIGLGLPAGLLLWEHRVKMAHLLGLRGNH